MSIVTSFSMFRVILADVVPKNIPKPQVERHFAELVKLIETLGGMSVVKVIQRRGRPSGSTYLGTGKADEVAALAKEMKVDGVIINGMLKGSQIHNLSQKITCALWDRVDVILYIFDRHATTAEAKLQIQRARIEYDIAKLYRRDAKTLFERERGGRGTVVRGSGERGIEAERRHIREQIRRIDEKIAEMRLQRKNRRDRRRRNGLLTAVLVGYTNAGKSSVMRALTGKDVLVADKLFATLDTRMGSIWLPNLMQKMLIGDTIGFIENLPPNLIAAFQSTLEEATEADVLLHIFDASETLKEQKRKHRVVRDILRDLDCIQPILQVGNKIDLLSANQIQRLEKKSGIIAVSAEGKMGLEKLIETIEKTVGRSSTPH